MNTSRAENTFLTLIVILSVINIKMAFMHAAELLVLFLVTIPAIIIFYMNKNVDNGNHNS